jgi:hypothetical protein
MPSTVEPRVTLNEGRVVSYSDERFHVTRTPTGWTIELIGEDPETRYIPLPKPLHVRVLDRIWLGWLGAYRNNPAA